MSAVLTPPSPAQTPPPRGATATPPQPFRWTVAQFHQLGEDGLFGDRRVQLIRGVIYEDEPMNPPHAVAGEKTEEAIRAAFGPGWRVRVEKPLALGQDTDPRPDVAVIAGRPMLAGGHPTTADLVVEIADTTFDHDTTEKAELYATAGVADYWVLDVDRRELHIFRDPAPLPAGLVATAYQTRRTLAETDTVSPLALPTATVRIADLLP